jgi:hypothetical protein
MDGMDGTAEGKRERRESLESSAPLFYGEAKLKVG